MANGRRLEQTDYVDSNPAYFPENITSGKSINYVSRKVLPSWIHCGI